MANLENDCLSRAVERITSKWGGEGHPLSDHDIIEYVVYRLGDLSCRVEGCPVSWLDETCPEPCPAVGCKSLVGQFNCNDEFAIGTGCTQAGSQPSSGNDVNGD